MTTEGVEVRRLRAGDVDAFVAYWAVSDRFEEDPDTDDDGERPTRDAIDAFLADPTVLFWIAEHDGRCIGMLHCYVQRRGAPGAWAELLLYEIGVDRDWRRPGVGRSLMDAAYAHMAAHGIEEIWVPAAATAIPFYAALGFGTDDGQVMSLARPR